MKIAEFETYLVKYGSDRTRWPTEIREAAEALIADSEEARVLLRAEERLSALFAATIPPAPDAGPIVQRTTARPLPKPAPLLAKLLRPGEPVFGGARILVLASCLGVGLLVGIFSAPPNHESNVLNLIDGSAFEVNDE